MNVSSYCIVSCHVALCGVYVIRIFHIDRCLNGPNLWISFHVIIFLFLSMNICIGFLLSYVFLENYPKKVKHMLYQRRINRN